MRKILLGLALALVTVCGLRADFTMNPMNGVNFGFPLTNQAAIGENRSGGQYCTSSFVGVPQVNVVVGEPLVYVNAVTYTANTANVSGTATANDVNFAGFAVTSAFASSSSCPTTVQVCTEGVVNELSLVTTTVGQRMALTATDETVAFNNSPYPAYGTLGCTYGNITSTTFSALTGSAAATTYTAQATGYAIGRAIQNVTAVGTPVSVPVQFP